MTDKQKPPITISVDTDLTRAIVEAAQEFRASLTDEQRAKIEGCRSSLVPPPYAAEQREAELRRIRRAMLEEFNAKECWLCGSAISKDSALCPGCYAYQS